MQYAKESLGKFESLITLPSLSTEREVIIPDNTNLLINDVSLSETQLQSFAKLLKPDVAVLETPLLNENLTNALAKSNICLASPTIVCYPLSGGKYIKETLDFDRLLPSDSKVIEFDIPCRRSQTGTEPEVAIPEPLVQMINQDNVRNIAILDDVTVTGLTASAIKKTLEFLLLQQTDSNFDTELRFSWEKIPRQKPINWTLAVWLVGSRRSRLQQNLTGFNTIISGLGYQRKSGQAPCNSLSTLLRDDQKSRNIAATYGQKFAKRAQDFQQYIQLLREEL